MAYIIEGTVSELSVDDNFFTIKGTEGFVIEQNKKKYNVLCPENMPEKNKKLLSAILSQDFEFPICDNNKELLLESLCHGKKIRIKLSMEDNEIQNSIDLQKLQDDSASENPSKKKYSITLLAN